MRYYPLPRSVESALDEIAGKAEMAGVGRKPNTEQQPAGPEPGGHAYMTVVARAKALIPQLRDRAANTEELRRLPPETERDLHDAGLFRIVQPKRVGGSELDYVSLVDCADMPGRADASVAWNFANLASHHWMLGMFDPRAQDEVWGRNFDTLIASSFIFPAGRARKVEGGYRLRGNWPFSSGVASCEWNMLASVVSSDDEADGIEYRIFLVHRNDYNIVDTWNAAGLRGTGSNDVEVKDAFIAEPMADARRGHIPDIAAKTKSRRDGAFSVNLCTDAVSMLFAASGARGLFTTGVLQRQFRDAHAINSHIAFNFDAAGTNYGRVALGVPSENLTL